MTHAELLSIRLGYEPGAQSRVSDSEPEPQTNKRSRPTAQGEDRIRSPE